MRPAIIRQAVWEVAQPQIWIGVKLVDLELIMLGGRWL
jgi:hypothetical protein